MSNELTYRGYSGSVEYDSEDRILHGKVLFIDSLLLYHGSSIDELERAFQETVGRYLEHCQKTGKSPNKPYSGTFNVRIGAERHRAVAQVAYRRRTSINDVVCQAVDAYLISEGAPVIVNHHHHHSNIRTQSVAKDSPVMDLSVKDQTWEDLTVGGGSWAKH